jgi:type 1 glutamine amidotransferase
MFIRDYLHRKSCVLLGATLRAAAVLAAVLCASAALGAKPDPTPQIAAALPARVTVQPKQPRKLLLFNTKRHHAAAAAVAAKAIEMMGKKTGVWTTTISDDPAVFEAEGLKGFDAVCINNTDPFFGDMPARMTSEEREAAEAVAKRREHALLAYVRGGGGVIGFHGTGDNRSPALQELLGCGNFAGHPWSEEVGIRVDDPQHALTRSFGGQSFSVVEEIYTFANKEQPDFRKQIRVLLTLDMTRTAPKGKRADQDYIVAWVRKVGEGRLFYSSLGHYAHIFLEPKILRFYQDGIQFALGDLEADVRTSAEVGIAPPSVTVPAPGPKTKK